MIDTLKKQSETIRKQKDIMERMNDEIQMLKAVNQVSNIDFPNSKEGSKTYFRDIDINDILSN